jgi:hypothetical protein
MVEPLVTLYDTELLAAEKVLHALNAQVGKHRTLERFRKEIIGRFEEIGLVMDVVVWETTTSGPPYAFEVAPIGRTEKVNWDFDRQAHEIRNDVLEILPPSERGQYIKAELPQQKPHKH